MTDRTKLQIYVTTYEAEQWRAAAVKEGATLSLWIADKVRTGRLVMPSLGNLHRKVDELTKTINTI